MSVPTGPPAENPVRLNLQLPPVRHDLRLKQPTNPAADIGEQVAVQRASARVTRYGESNPSVIGTNKMSYEEARQLKPELLFSERAELSNLLVYIVEMQGTFKPPRGRPPFKPGTELEESVPRFTYNKAYIILRAADGAVLKATLLKEE